MVRKKNVQLPFIFALAMECLINSECYSNYEPLRLMTGIEREKTMADKLMNISNYDTKITLSVDYNYWLLVIH